MKDFGTLKSKIIKKLSDSYTDGTLKEDIKLFFNPIMENKEIKNLYVFYEDVENKTISDVESANNYVNEISIALKGRNKNINKFITELDKKLGDVSDVELNEVYKQLDILLCDDKLGNISEKITAKKKLSEHLLKTKKTDNNLVEHFSINDRLLHAVMVNSFNEKFTSNLNEEEKKELKEILNLNEEQLKVEINTIKESVLDKVGVLLSETTDDVLKSKLNDVVKEVKIMTNTKFNYYKLKKLQSEIL